MAYWQDRLIQNQINITDANIGTTEAQLKKYYKTSMKKVISNFEATYDKYLTQIANNKEPTPALLYNMDRYWQMQVQLKRELQKLGDKEYALLSTQFQKQWEDIYKALAYTSNSSFGTISILNAKQMINQIWAADGKAWSERVWENTSLLADKLNEELINCATIGKKTTELKEALMSEFGVSYSRANTLVRTEMAHLQTQAAAQAYKDDGIEYYKFVADPDEKTCSICSKMDGKKFKLSEMKPGVNAVPMHPRDRCCIVPVVE